MQQIAKMLSDIFSMGFDIIIPLSGCIVAFVIALILFSIRYGSFSRNKRKFERAHRNDAVQIPVSAPVPDVAAMPAHTGNELNDGAPVPCDALVAGLITASAQRPQEGSPISDCPELDRRFGEEMDAALREYTGDAANSGQGSKAS